VETFFIFILFFNFPLTWMIVYTVTYYPAWVKYISYRMAPDPEDRLAWHRLGNDGTVSFTAFSEELLTLSK